MEPSRSTSPSVLMIAEGEKLPKDIDRTPSFHQGGTIDDITRQISQLDTSLHKYNSPSQLVVDKYLKEHGLELEAEEEEFGYGKLKIDYKPHKPATRTMTDKESEIKEVKRFAGMFSVRSALQPSSQSPLQGVMKDSKWKTSSCVNKKAEKSKGMKPMLVELHVFPGFEPKELTPLPPPLLSKEILIIVIKAQQDLHRKPTYKKYLKSQLISKMSQAVIQDIFWWYFLEKYQVDKRIQELLFNRIAHNYVKLLFSAPINEFRDTFFKRYPGLVAEAVYCTFCSAFPTSYKQFDAKFKEDLVQVVYIWMVGTKPVPRSWEKWKLNVLEPADMRKDEQIKKDASKGSLVHLPLDLTEENLAQQSSLDKGLNKNLPTIVEDRTSLLSMKRDLRRKSTIRPPKENSLLGLPGDTSRTDLRNRASFDLLDCTAALPITGLPTPAPSRISIRESNMSFLQSGQRDKRKRESCTVGRGAQFTKALFDVNGHSPLVEQFLKMQRLAKDAGTGIFVQRTEISALPPLDAETYNDLIRRSLKLSKEMCGEFRKLYDEDQKKRSQFVKKRKQGYKDYVRRQNDLLSRQKDVKKISDLLVLELMKDGDEQSSGKAAAAIASAMGYSADSDHN